MFGSMVSSAPLKSPTLISWHTMGGNTLLSRICAQLVHRFFFFQAEDGIRDYKVTGVQTCALPISSCAHAKVAAAHRARMQHIDAPIGALRLISLDIIRSFRNSLGRGHPS